MTRWLELLLIAICLTCIAVGAEDPATAATDLHQSETPSSQPSTRPSPALLAQLDSLFHRLDDSNYRVRELATRELDTLPPEALPIIEQTIASGATSPEVRLHLEVAMSLLRRHAIASRYERQLQQAAAFDRMTAIADYLQGGHVDARWDESARQAIALSVQPIGQLITLPSERLHLARALHEALDAGCDDPLVQYLFETEQERSGDVTRDEAAERIEPIVDRLVASKCSPWRKMTALAHRTQVNLAIEGPARNGSIRGRIDSDLNAALDLLPDAVAQAGFPPSHLRGFALRALDEESQLLQDREAALKKVMPIVAHVAPSAAMTALIEGEFRLHDVQADRQGAYQWTEHRDATPEAHNARIKQELSLAGDLLTRAADADLSDPNAPSLMLQWADVSSANEQVMQHWFERAMTAYPSSNAACLNKLRYLEHHADVNAVLNFGRECSKTRDWSSRLPLILVDAQLFCAQQSQGEYFADRQTWNEIRSVFESHLIRYPGSVSDRSSYAWVACQAERWDTANKQFDLLGGEAVPERFGGEANLAYLREKASRSAMNSKAPTQPEQ